MRPSGSPAAYARIFGGCRLSAIMTVVQGDRRHNVWDNEPLAMQFCEARGGGKVHLLSGREVVHLNTLPSARRVRYNIVHFELFASSIP